MQFTHRLICPLAWSWMLALIFIGSGSLQPALLAAPAVKLIPLHHAAAGVAVNSRTNRIYVSAQATVAGMGGLSVIDGSANRLIDSVDYYNVSNVFGNNVAVDEVRNKIYVASISGATDIFDGKTDAFLGGLGAGAQGVAVNPITNRIYALSPDAASGASPSTVTVLDGSTYRTIASIQIPQPDPFLGVSTAVAVNPVTNKIYVVGGGSTRVIDGRTNTIVATLDAGESVAVNAITNTIYVAVLNNITAIDGQTGKVIATIDPGDNVNDIAVNPNINRVYVTLAHQLKVINGVTNRIIESVPLPNLIIQSVAANPVTGIVYVTTTDAANNGFVAVIDDSAAYPSHPDTTPPQVSITTPANNAMVGSLPSLSGRAADNAGGSGVTRVTVFLRRVRDGAYWNGTRWVTQPVGLDATLTGNTWTVRQNLPYGADLEEGGYRILAVAFDAHNNRASASSSFKIDKTAPQVSFTFPKAGATLTNLSYVAGRIVDNTTAADQVLLYLRRLSDGSYWTGSAWSQQPVALTTSVAGNVWARRGGLPNASQLGSDSYRLIAFAVDPADNRGSATIAITTRNGG